MTTQGDLVAVLKRRLQEIETEREHVLDLLRVHGATNEKQNGARPATATKATTKSHRAARKPKPKRAGNPFQPQPGGPTETILGVLGGSPGLTFSEIVDRAAKAVKTDAANPKRSIESTLYGMRDRGRVVVRDGKYYAVQQ